MFRIRSHIQSSKGVIYLHMPPMPGNQLKPKSICWEVGFDSKTRKFCPAIVTAFTLVLGKSGISDARCLQSSVPYNCLTKINNPHSFVVTVFCSVIIAFLNLGNSTFSWEVKTNAPERSYFRFVFCLFVSVSRHNGLFCHDFFFPYCAFWLLVFWGF